MTFITASVICLVVFPNIIPPLMLFYLVYLSLFLEHRCITYAVLLRVYPGLQIFADFIPKCFHSCCLHDVFCYAYFSFTLSAGMYESH